jgi:hypothetical protein
LKSELLVSGPDGRSHSEKQAARHVEEREARLGAEAAGRFSEEVARQDRHLAQMMQTAAETRENKAIDAIIDALSASGREGGVAVVEVGQGAVIAVNDPAQGPAAVQLALDRGKDIAVLSPGILNTDANIANNARRLAKDTGRTVIALGNDSKGLGFVDGGDYGSGPWETMLAAVIDLLEATASEFGVPSSNSILAESVLTPLNAALEGRNDLNATVIAHSRGAIDVENAAESAGGFPNLGLITVGGAALPSRGSWRWSEEFVGLDPVGNAALARRFILGRGDTLPSPTGALHSFDSYYHCVLGLLLPRVPWTEQPGAENRGVWKR